MLTQTPSGEPLPVDPFAHCRRALVLAPHFDDEVIACGGTILRHLARGHSVTVLYFTDGSAASGSDLTPAALSAVRMAESGRSNTILGVVDQRYLHQQDGALQVTDELAYSVYAALAEADIVYAPHPRDAHPDHQAVFRILQMALARSPRQPAVAYYEFWRPQAPNWYLDVSELMATKVRALREHQSQLRFLDYIRLMMVLNEYRGRRIGTAYAEAYHYRAAQSTEEV